MVYFFGDNKMFFKRSKNLILNVFEAKVKLFRHGLNGK